MIWIGLTGGIGSGKSSVAAGLKQRGWPVIDADHIARQVLVDDGELLKEIRKEFGGEVFAVDGKLDRRRLGKLVFGQKARLETLESILHPAIQAETARQRSRLEQSGADLAIYDVPLLFEKGLEKQFDQIIVVDAPLDKRTARVLDRDGISQAELESRILSQEPLEEKVLRADYVVDNSGDKAGLEQEIDALANYLQAQT